MTRISKKVIATVVALVGVIGTASIANSPSHIGPAYLYPDNSLTPGLVATSDFSELTSKVGGQTYSQAHRKTTEAMKKQVCAEYPTNCQNKVEIDHFCPLALGCADDVKNLWAQPEVNVWNGKDYGFHTKDKLESFLVIEMKKGNIPPIGAQQCILKDWVACYEKYLGKTGVSSSNDPDS